MAELVRIYKPFEGTPKDWKACQGSNPKYRGYPCSLWTLFHTLTVNAAIKGDPSMQYGCESINSRKYQPMFASSLNHFSSQFCGQSDGGVHPALL